MGVDWLLARLGDVTEVSDAEEILLREFDVRSWEALSAMTSSFPSLFQNRGANRAKLSFAASNALRGSAFAARSSARAQSPRSIGAPLGARPPRGHSVKKGSVAISFPYTPSPGKAANRRSESNLTLPNAVRDQGDRGTCVAHAVVACREYACPTETKLSEQFLFWAAKQHDGDDADGTWIKYALKGLGSQGVCKWAEWPYDGRVLSPPNVSHADHPTAPTPSISARNCAANQVTLGVAFRDTVGTSMSGHARYVREALVQEQVPVAISVPVFADPDAPAEVNNWTNDVAWDYGVIFDPTDNSGVVGGHAVAVVGFEADDTVKGGGYFIFRNSWGTDWGGQVIPAPEGYDYVKSPGFGAISAFYVDHYLYEAAIIRP